MKKKGHPSSVVDRLMDQRSSLYLTFLYISFPHLPHLPFLPFLPPPLSLSLSLSLFSMLLILNSIWGNSTQADA